MNRCTTTFLPPSTIASGVRHRLLAGLAGALLFTALPAASQVPVGLGGMRAFPDDAQRGNLTITSVSEASLNGRSIRLAPGMRLLSPQNTLVMAHTVVGQSFKVNYLIEASTGMLITAWILTQGEAEQPRRGSDTVQRNFRADSDTARR